MGPCADDIVGTGNDEGQIAPDFQLIDQFGDVLRLYDFCEHTVLLASVAFWDGAGKAAAPELEAWYQELKDDGLIIVSLLTDANGGDQTPITWANQFGISHPVVDDANAGVTNAYGTGGYYPNYHILGPGAEVILRVGSGSTMPSKSDIEAILSQME